MAALDESVIEQAAPAWLESPEWQVRNGAGIGSGELAAERDDVEKVVLSQRQCEVLLPIASGDLRLKDAEKFVGRAV